MVAEVWLEISSDRWFDLISGLVPFIWELIR